MNQSKQNSRSINQFKTETKTISIRSWIPADTVGTSQAAAKRIAKLKKSSPVSFKQRLEQRRRIDQKLNL